MARKVYSSSFPDNQKDLCAELVEDLQLLCEYLGKRKLKILKWDDEKIVIPLQVNVQLPPRGTYQGIDIRRKENILFVFHRTKYPDVAPRVYSDRKNFPKDKLSHIYIAKDNRPVPFCLVRGNYQEWFADKRITDLVVRVKNWLGDAASGALVEDGGQFDPMRLEGYRGTIIYKYHELAEVVNSQRTIDNAKNFALLLIVEREAPEPGKRFPSYEVKEVLTNSSQVKEAIKPILETLAKHKEGLVTTRLMFGALVWQEKNEPNQEFITDLPNDFNSLLAFGTRTGIDLKSILEWITILKLPSIDEVPLLIGLKRPKPLIGYSGDIEFFNYYLSITDGDIEENRIVNNIPVAFQKHNEPLSVKKAQEVSGSENLLGSALVFGCGAIGSKVVMHLIREGYNKFTLFDGDKIEPHNMVRYGLTDEVIGMNKASALEITAKNLFKADKLKILGLPINGNYFFENEKLRKLQETYDWIIDFTASSAFENYFIKKEMEPGNQVAKACLVDSGKIGMLLIEGKDRNPRIDDLRILSQAMYQEYSFISDWLVGEYENRKKASILISVGVGCNSETTIISDDLISLHSASFVRGLKDADRRKNERDGGSIYLTRLNHENFELNSNCWEVKPLIILQDLNSGIWEIRIKNGLDTIMKAEMGKAMPKETGGIMIGQINYKTKCIHVTDIVLAPPDSEANETCFIRGVEGLPDIIDEHKKNSGQTFGYIGEWHSHPKGPMGLSIKDVQTMKGFKREYKKTGVPIPVFVMIVTPMGLHPFVY